LEGLERWDDDDLGVFGKEGIAWIDCAGATNISFVVVFTAYDTVFI
jgi:hypothetical protein